MKKIHVDRQDSSRILLTEVLPYETPIFFSNALLYSTDKSLRNKSSNAPALVTRLLNEEITEPRVPYDFPIIHSADKTRTLSIIHPTVQRKFVDFYAENSDLLLYLCSKSPFTLRSPSRVASQYVEKALSDSEERDLKDSGPEVEPGGFDIQTRFASSYFQYRDYAYLYKFYESRELLRLEKRFRYVLQFDIARCFNSIYTHWIAWAAKEKAFAKANKSSHTVEREFDKLMQSANYDETHGIVIGPEASRIFAEIILQRVDADVLAELERRSIRFKIDYSVRRYVDDYFVFAVNEDVARTVQSVFEQTLRDYKLYINEQKTSFQKTPMMSSQSIAKIRARRAVDTFFSALVFPSDKSGAKPQVRLFRPRRRHPAWVRTVEELKVIERETGAGYEGLAQFCLVALRNECARVLSSANGSKIRAEPEDAAEYCIALLEVAFFLYSMDTRVRTTYVLAQIVSSIHRVTPWLGIDQCEVVEKKMLDELIDAVDRIKAIRCESSIEIANLLILLRTLQGGYRMPAKRLAECFRLGYRYLEGSLKCEGLEKLGYFEIITLLYCAGNDAEYSALRTQVVESVVRRFEDSEMPHRDTELTLLFFDLLACPYIQNDIKGRLIEVVSEATGTSSQLKNAGESARITRYCERKIHWVDWQGELNVANALEKKELRTPYGEW